MMISGCSSHPARVMVWGWGYRWVVIIVNPTSLLGWPMSLEILGGPGVRRSWTDSLVSGGMWGDRWLIRPHTSGTVGPSGKSKFQKPFQYNDYNIKNQPTLSVDGVEVQERPSVLWAIRVPDRCVPSPPPTSCKWRPILFFCPDKDWWGFGRALRQARKGCEPFPSLQFILRRLFTSLLTGWILLWPGTLISPNKIIIIRKRELDSCQGGINNCRPHLGGAEKGCQIPSPPRPPAVPVKEEGSEENFAWTLGGFSRDGVWGHHSSVNTGISAGKCRELPWEGVWSSDSEDPGIRLPEFKSPHSHI